MIRMSSRECQGGGRIFSSLQGCFCGDGEGFPSVYMSVEEPKDMAQCLEEKEVRARFWFDLILFYME